MSLVANNLWKVWYFLRFPTSEFYFDKKGEIFKVLCVCVLRVAELFSPPSCTRSQYH